MTAPPAPTPRILYVHDDLRHGIYNIRGEQSKAYQLTRDLFGLVRRRAPAVVILSLRDQCTQLIAHRRHTPFSLTIGIGQAGSRVAQQLHALTGWFPRIQCLDVTREEETDTGCYRLRSFGNRPLAEQLKDTARCTSVAVVDDTVFSGLTMRTVLQALPTVALGRAHAFCLRCASESLITLRDLCPITVGFAAAGRILDQVSFINASGLVQRISIRRVGQPPLAFFDRPEWMRAWFRAHAEEVTALCRRVNALLEPTCANPSEGSVGRSDADQRNSPIRCELVSRHGDRRCSISSCKTLGSKAKPNGIRCPNSVSIAKRRTQQLDHL